MNPRIPRLLLAGLALGLFVAPLSAAFISVDADRLRDAFANPLPLSGLVVLTASTDGIFSGPTPSLFGGGSEVLLKKWDLSDPASWQTTGVFSGVTEDFSYSDLSPLLTAGNLLQLYWFPTLTLSSSAPGFNTAYGSYRDPATTTAALIDGGDLWKLPGENGTIGLTFATSDYAILFSNGSNTPQSATASLTTVPEPSIYLGAGVFALLVLTYRRLQCSSVLHK